MERLRLFELFPIGFNMFTCDIAGVFDVTVGFQETDKAIPSFQVCSNGAKMTGPIPVMQGILPCPGEFLSVPIISSSTDFAHSENP